MKYSLILIVLMTGFSIEARMNRLGVQYYTFFKNAMAQEEMTT